jgi:hypothetical protein
MSLLRILRNVAVLVILTVGGLGFTPRATGAQYLACPSARCSSWSVCQACYGGGCSSRCRFPHHGLAIKCYDYVYHRSCFRCVCT